MGNGRYIRQVQVPGFSTGGQQKLKQAKVLVVGAGGLGVPVLQYLAGMGIGTIGIMDGDTISLDNLHRQVLYSEDEVSRPKAEVAASKLSKLNSEIEIKAITDFLSRDNALELIAEYDLVIDTSDNFGTRYLINDACVILNKPFIYGAIHGFEGQVSVFNYQGGPTYRCLFPNPPKANEIPDCNEAGVLGIVPGLIGMQQALQAVKLLTGMGEVLSGQMLILDLKTDEQYKIKLKANPANKEMKTLQDTYDVPFCASSGGPIEVEELFKWYADERPFYLIDVREKKEFELEHLQFAHSYPLSTLSERLNTLPDHVPLVTICEIGGRSASAAKLIQSTFPDRSVFNVIGGMEAWLDELGDQLIVEPQNTR